MSQSAGKKKAKRKGASFILMLLADGCFLAALILYLRDGTNEFVPALSGMVITLLTATLGGAVLMTIFEVKAGRNMVFLAGVFTWLDYMITEVNYFSNLVTSTDDSAIDPAVVMMIILPLAGFILTKMSGSFQSDWTDVEVVETGQQPAS